jgi:phosphate transport system substrate-binding protein
VRPDHMASAEDRVVTQAVARDPAASGIVSLAYHLDARTRLGAVPVMFPGASSRVAPSIDAVARGVDRPLTRPLFLYASVRALEQPHVAAFAAFYVGNAARFAKEQNYVPLSAAL